MLLIKNILSTSRVRALEACVGTPSVGYIDIQCRPIHHRHWHSDSDRHIPTTAGPANDLYALEIYRQRAVISKEQTKL